MSAITIERPEAVPSGWASFLRHEDALLTGRVHGTPAISFALGVNDDGEPEQLHFYAQPGVPHITLTGPGSADSVRSLIVQLAGNNGRPELRINVLGTDTSGEVRRIDVVDGVVEPSPERPEVFLARALKLATGLADEIERREAVMAEYGVDTVHEARHRAVMMSKRSGARVPDRHPLNLPYSVLVVEGSALAAQPTDSPEVLASRIALMNTVETIAARGGDAGVLLVLAAEDLTTVPAAIIARTHIVRLGGDAHPYAQFILDRADTAEALTHVMTRYRA